MVLGVVHRGFLRDDLVQFALTHVARLYSAVADGASVGGGGDGAGTVAASRPELAWPAWAWARWARSTAWTTRSGCDTPRKLKSESVVPAVSKSTVPICSIRSRTPWPVLTFWARSMRVSWMWLASRPRRMCRRSLVTT